MPDLRQIRRWIVPLMLMAQLLVATAAGAAWHHHANSDENTCPICHLNHQPFVQALADNRLAVLEPLGLQADPTETGFTPAPSFYVYPRARLPLSGFSARNSRR